MLIVASVESLIGSIWAALAFGCLGLIGGFMWCRKQGK